MAIDAKTLKNIRSLNITSIARNSIDRSPHGYGRSADTVECKAKSLQIKSATLRDIERFNKECWVSVKQGYYSHQAVFTHSHKMGDDGLLYRMELKYISRPSPLKDVEALANAHRYIANALDAVPEGSKVTHAYGSKNYAYSYYVQDDAMKTKYNKMVAKRAGLLAQAKQGRKEIAQEAKAREEARAKKEAAALLREERSYERNLVLAERRAKTELAKETLLEHLADLLVNGAELTVDGNKVVLSKSK